MVERLKCSKTPAAVGPYCVASRVENLIFTSGQLPINKETGKIDNPESIEEQTIQSMKNIQAILEENNSSIDKIVKVTVYLDSISDFQKFNEVYSTFFTGEYPARTCFEVGGLPNKALVEIECIAEVE